MLFKKTITFYFKFTGSPADKDNLEVGDEILEVNGKTLEDATHTEVISHIHQVIIISKKSTASFCYKCFFCLICSVLGRERYV